MQDAASKQQTKQKYKPSHQQTGLPPHSALSIRVKTNKQSNKNSVQISSYRKLTQSTGLILGGQQPKGRKNSTLMPGGRRIMKRQRSTTQMKEQTRNIEVQINEEEIGKLPEKEFRIMIVKISKNLESKMEKMEESIKKT